MFVRIPTYSKRSRNEELTRCVEFASRKSGVDEYRMTHAMSYFLEQLAEEVTRGRVVCIPGFGIFAPVSDKRPTHRSFVNRCRIRFHPARGFQQQVKYGSPPKEENRKQFTKYRFNHHGGESGQHVQARVNTSLEEFRRSISAQLANARDE